MMQTSLRIKHATVHKDYTQSSSECVRKTIKCL